MADFITNDPLVSDQPATQPASSGGFITNDPVANNLNVRDPNVPTPSTVPQNATPQMVHTDTTLAGRILDNFNAGLTSVIRPIYGDEPFGFSDATKQALRKYGIYNDVVNNSWSPVKAFNETVMTPLAAGFDLVNRTIQAVPHVIAEDAGHIAGSLGLLEPGPGNSQDRFIRDTKTLLDTTAIVTAMEGHYFGTTEDVNTAARQVKAEPPMPSGGPVSASVASSSPKIALGVDMAASKYVDKAGNINLKNIAAPDDVKAVIIDQAIEHAPEIASFGRNTVGFNEIAQLAHDSGISAQTLIDRNIGTAWNAEQIYAARNLLVQSAADVKDLATKALGGDDASLVAFTQALDRHAMIQAQVSGVTAEAGRALAQFRMATKAGVDLRPVIEDPAIRGDATKLAQAIANLNTPQQVSKVVADVSQFSTLDKIQQVWIAGLLSGPQTHVANTIGNTIMALWRIGETGTAGAIGTVRQMFGGSSTDRVFLGEAAAKMYGIMQGMPEGILAAAKTLLTDKPSSITTKLESTLPAGGAIGGPVGRAVNLLGPTELLAEDELFKTVAQRASLHAQAYAQASREGLTGNAFFSRIGDLVANPSEKMMDIAEASAKYDTFRQSLGATGRHVQAIINNNPWSKFIIPFVRTPINLLKAAAERTPLSIASKDVRDTLAGLKGQAAQDEQIAKIALGTSVLTAGLGLAAKGQLTGGGPKDPAQRAALMATGWRPYSFKTDTGYSSYARFEPLATILGIIADAYEIGSKIGTPEAQDIGVLIAKSASNNILSKTWLSGLASTLNAATDPENSGGKWIKQMAGSFVPTGMAQAAKIEDPYLRDVRTILDNIKSRIPYESETLPHKIDLFGNPIKRDSALGPDLLSPVFQSQVNADPILADMIHVKSFPAPIERQIRGVELDGKRYEELSVMSGKLSRFMLENVYNTSGFNTLPDGVRKDIIDRIFKQTREMARNQMLLKYPDIMEQAAKNKIETLQGKFK